MFTERTPDFYSDKSEGDLLMFSLVLCDLDVEIDFKFQTQKLHFFFFTLKLQRQSIIFTKDIDQFPSVTLIATHYLYAIIVLQTSLTSYVLAVRPLGRSKMAVCVHIPLRYFLLILLAIIAFFSPIKTTLSIIPIISTLNE